MSVAIARADKLCDKCVMHGVVTETDLLGPVEIAVDGNDLCKTCIHMPGSYVREVDYEVEAALVKRVVKRSPWCKALRRQQLFDRYWSPIILIIGALTLIGTITWACASAIRQAIEALP